MRDDSETERDILDVGSTLKKEKLQKENQEKIEVLKQQFQKEQEVQKSSSPSLSFTKWGTLIFLLIIVATVIGTRLYVASMPITEEWAEQVVTQNLQIKVSNAVYETYPTLSDAKKQELIQEGTTQAVAAQQNKNAIESLAETYKQSYKDPEGNSYLYEIDPYFFYEIAQNKDSTLSVHAHNLLSFIERGFYTIFSFFSPRISFVEAIFYLPLIFTLFCAVIIFFIGKEIWDERAGCIAGIIFVVHPILLEFSMLGFVDTNMLNMFFILLTGLLFLSIIHVFRKKEKRVKDYGMILILSALCFLFIFFFRYAWSAWYISIALIVVPAILLFLIVLKNILQHWKTQTLQTKKRVVTIVLLGILCIGILVQYGLGHEEGVAVTRIEQNILTPTLKKYLHVEYEDPYGKWPDAFILIKELQQTDVTAFINYLGGNIALLFSLPVILYLFYKGVRERNGTYLYLIAGYGIFIILSFRAIRLLPYFIPYFALSIGITIAIIASWILKKIQPMLIKEKKAMQRIYSILVYCILIFLVVYPLFEKIAQTSRIMPIMDDAIYNSAIFIQENSQQNAFVSAWWDRGTFYKALAELEVHLHSQPAMPRTYWLASFYMTENEVQARNILSLINCNAEASLRDVLKARFTDAQAINSMKGLLGYEAGNERDEYLNSTLGIVQDENKRDLMYDGITEILYCKEAETYVVVIDDLMPRFSAVEYFANWDFAAQQADPTFPYVEIDEYGCAKNSAGAVCSIGGKDIFLNFTSLEVTGAAINEVYLVANETVQYKNWSTANEDAADENVRVLIVYNRAGYWKAAYLPKVIADSMYVRLMLLDGYNTPSFEKVFDEVHVETSWVKVYKINLGAKNVAEE